MFIGLNYGSYLVKTEFGNKDLFRVIKIKHKPRNEDYIHSSYPTNISMNIFVNLKVAIFH